MNNGFLYIFYTGSDVCRLMKTSWKTIHFTGNYSDLKILTFLSEVSRMNENFLIKLNIHCGMCLEV